MELTYIRDLTHNYMVVQPSGAGEDFALRMALTQNIDGLIPVEARMIDDELYLYYQTDSLLSLQNLSLVRRPGHRELKELFHALLRTERMLTDYLIGTDSLYLTPETVFTDPSDGSWHFTCMPFPHREGTPASFCESLLGLLDPDDSDAIADAYRICDRVQEGNARLRDLVRLLSEEEEETEHTDTYTKKKTAAVTQDDKGWVNEERIDQWFDEHNQAPSGQAEEEEERKPLVRPGILAVLFAVVFLADLYLRKTYLLTGAGNILSLAVAAVCLAGAVGAFVYGLRSRRQGEDLSEAGWTSDPGYELWEDVYDRDEGRYAQGAEAMYDEQEREDLSYAAEEAYDDEEGTVLLSSTGNKRRSKLYGRNSVNNCNITLDRLPLTLGKLAGRVDLQLLDKSVSRVHAHINRDSEGGIVVKDMNSTNGTFLNGIRLRPNESVQIRTGDEICFGNMVFEYL